MIHRKSILSFSESVRTLLCVRLVIITASQSWWQSYVSVGILAMVRTLETDLYFNCDTRLSDALTMLSDRRAACVSNVISVMNRLHDWSLDALEKSHFFKFAAPFGGRL